MIYTLFNESTGKQLVLPRLGPWHTTCLADAKYIQKSARKYMREVGMKSMIQYVQIRDEDGNVIS